ncbi:hypothetical protein HHI36_007937 [Cryptolaemus montrouzieri]|uniref:Uncharacterized protein n=1 Tax=Cryptolaemus montrouzieri TaxID=559131 RepID=A0ABD2MQX9_9CUCU
MNEKSFNRFIALEKNLSSMNGDSNPKVPEILDRVTKAHNLINCNLPESSDESSDKASASKITDHIVANSSQFLVSFVRLPARDVSRPRWIRLTFSYGPQE